MSSTTLRICRTVVGGVAAAMVVARTLPAVPASADSPAAHKEHDVRFVSSDHRLVWLDVGFR
jgi:hypothetical protein